MAMLAEPRQRKRYNLVPRGKALYEDESRFGTKMLEKMGWEKGKGLGANEDGTKDFVRLRYKNDALGLGFEHRDDQWTQHEQSFNGLLKTLNNEEEAGDSKMKQENGNVSDDNMPRIGFGFQDSSAKPKVEKLKEKISGISLEERSKQSKARVHYKKFTKGKDLAQYSEKDLANIFGKKVAEEKDAANDFYMQLNKTFEREQEDTKDDDEEPNKGVQIINTGISVSDYFKTKMEALKNRKNGFDNADNSANKDTSNEILFDEDVSKKKKKNKKEKKDQDMDMEVNNVEETKKVDSNSLITNSEVSVTDYFKMKMEAMKNKKKDLINAENNVDTTYPDEQEVEVTKKKKKNKNEVMEQEHVVELENAIAIKEEKKLKKNKKNSGKELVDNDEMGKEVEEAAIKKEKKSKKSKEVNTEEIKPVEETKIKKKDKSKKRSQKEIVDQNDEVDLPKKKKEKHEDPLAENTIIPMEPTVDITEINLTQETTKKKEKKSKSKEIAEIVVLEDNKNEVNFVEKKKKKKSKKTKKGSQKDVDTAEKESVKSSEKPSKAKQTDVSLSAKNLLINDIDIKKDLDELKKKYKEFNIYPISSFCAEKFRNICLNDFTGSILPQIEGYGLNSDLQLDIFTSRNDEERITNLWYCVLNKYSQLEKPKKTYNQYVREVIKSRKLKKKAPKLYVKTWKRKHAFQIV